MSHEIYLNKGLAYSIAASTAIVNSIWDKFDLNRNRYDKPGSGK